MNYKYNKMRQLGNQTKKMWNHQRKKLPDIESQTTRGEYNKVRAPYRFNFTL